MNSWLIVLIGGLIVGVGGSAASLLIGLVMPADAFIYLSMMLSIGGWIAATAGLVGFLVSKGRQGSAKPD